MERNQDQRIEELSLEAGGRFKLTTLVLKRMREYYQGGRTFMPKARKRDELFDLVLDQIEKKEISLRLPENSSAALGGQIKHEIQRNEDS